MASDQDDGAAARNPCSYPTSAPDRVAVVQAPLALFAVGDSWASFTPRRTEGAAQEQAKRRAMESRGWIRS